MKDLFLITVPGNPVEKFVTDDITLLTGKYPLFLIEKIEYKPCAETLKIVNS